MNRHRIFASPGRILMVWALLAWAAVAMAEVEDTDGMPTISIDFQDARTPSVLRSFAEFSGINIVAGPEVKGTITARLDDVPWLTALDTVLRAHGYGWERSGSIIRVTTVDKLQNERLNEQVIERKREEYLPLETEVMRVDYANAAELVKPLETLLSSRGRVDVDERTNALVVTDIFDRLTRLRELVAILDFSTPQVEIVAKLVDVDARHVRELGIKWDALGMGGGDATISGGVATSIASAAGSVNVGLLGSDGDLSAVIDALERSNHARIISNPRITTADNREARILVGKKVPLVVADEAGNAMTELTTIGIKLVVTPHINSDSRVTLDLFPEVSDLSSQATVQGGIIIVTSQAQTRVIVRDGETAVIGGLIRLNESVSETGVPFLKDIPVLGNLFKSSNRTTEERELLIFVTPRIIEPQAS
ncbi:MAG: secretin N-terminal domain-containing protein [Gemmatimonadota bacterium]|nr:secretin N-terminal domain-containing protein [Gemmatimonadota bacterium]MDP6802181.1 secretin N-terminal domain-containing protein [Gemmatimonadota bacterium]MDP7031511.1 secretin N-terminal domain-containing protein [Gemmatimonadota bacterium]